MSVLSDKGFDVRDPEVGDCVIAVDGKYKGRTGSILYVFNGSATICTSHGIFKADLDDLEVMECEDE